MFKRNQIVTVGIAGVHCQYQAKVLRRTTAFGSTDWYIVREIPADADRADFLRRLPPAINGACVHESNLSAV